MAHLTPGQRRLRARIEAVIGIAAPALDVLLYAGDRVSRVAGRNDIDPEPPRRVESRPRTPLDAPRPRARRGPGG